jgi:hypothetical protein
MNKTVQAASTKTLLDEFMPVYDVAARYEIAVDAPASRVYETLLRHSLLDSLAARFLMTLRSLPGAIAQLLRGQPPQKFCIPSLNNIEESDFFKLAENPEEEIVLGLIGQFWKLRGGLVRIKNADEFVGFSKTGYTKAVINLLVSPLNENRSCLSTETRVRATEAMSRKKFLRYWKIIGPFSGLIRRDMLRRIKREAERVK